MAKLIMYLLESSAVLAFFYLLYVLVLRRETFFGLNRFFLISILVFSLLFPFLSFDLNPTNVGLVAQPIEEISKFRMSYYEAMASWEFDSQNAAISAEKKSHSGMSLNVSFDWANLSFNAFLAFYIIGIVVCLSRTVWTLRKILKMIATNPQEEIDGVTVIKINEGINNQRNVYQFVKKHVDKLSSNFVVSAGYHDDNTYNEYLVNLTYIQEGFNQVYMERAQEMFGRDLYELEKSDYDAVRKGIPRAISIADLGAHSELK